MLDGDKLMLMGVSAFQRSPNVALWPSFVHAEKQENKNVTVRKFNLNSMEGVKEIFYVSVEYLNPQSCVVNDTQVT